MLTLKSIAIPPTKSNTSLNIPISPSGKSSRSNPNSPTSSIGSGKSPVSKNQGYLPNILSSRKVFQPISKADALKNVKLLEEVLNAWNEHRLAVSNLGKTSRKLASALKDLTGKSNGIDKVDIAAQTIRPTATMLDNISDLTLKLSRKIDKQYDEVNSDASKYFTLLAKETRTHEAYLGAIRKKHDKAEKAYRKASKALSETSNAHAELLALKDTLSEDIDKANEDHQSLIENKQSMILLKLASSSGYLAASVFAYFSDGLRKSGQSYADIEYFRSLAEIKWQSCLPPSLEHEINEEKQREHVRGIKAKVALGELNMIGEAWKEGYEELSKGGDLPLYDSTTDRPESLSIDTKVSTQVLELEKKKHGVVKSPDQIGTPNQITNRTLGQTSRPISPPVPNHSRPSMSSYTSPTNIPSSVPGYSTTATSDDQYHQSPPTRVPVPSGLSATVPNSQDNSEAQAVYKEHFNGSHPQFESPTRLKPKLTRPDPIPIQIGHAQRRSMTSIINTIPHANTSLGHQAESGNTQKQKVSFEHSRSFEYDRREMEFQEHRLHTTFIKGCGLCENDYKRIGLLPPKNVRRVTMPPLYTTATSITLPDPKSKKNNNYNPLLPSPNQRNYQQLQKITKHERKTSYDYDELFVKSPHQQEQDDDFVKKDQNKSQYDTQNGMQNERPLLSPKPRKPLGLSPGLQKFS
ncbi:uncharacterized protein L201_004768 [Kwoniella dendrophila CBS 6074]|uniref:Uncharacterized protein n=1 Tax=Kwoniella dendrophila CBS 6074 TaxID=1295534 RepID=A0AAX4JZ29_9TREE